MEKMSKTKNNYQQLCVWQGVEVGDEKHELESWIKDKFDSRVKYLTEVKTNPDVDGDGNDVPDTGGRNDVFFYVHDNDINKFAVPRLQYGIRWWEDVVKYNDNSHLYTEEFLAEHKPKW